MMRKEKLYDRKQRSAVVIPLSPVDSPIDVSCFKLSSFLVSGSLLVLSSFHKEIFPSEYASDTV